MIEEAYCSFEVSKLLKKKGFGITTGYVYLGDNKGKVAKSFTSHFVKKHNDIIPCPTHQMALAWIRETHKIHVEIWAAYDQGTEEHIGWGITISNLADLGDVYLADAGRYKTFEEATEVALKHILDNLI